MLRTLLELVHAGPSGATVAAAAGFALLFRAGSPHRDTGRRLVRLMAMTAAQQVAISLHNDWCDRALDAATKPWRALPQGFVSPGLVNRTAWALAALSVVLAAPAGWRLVLLDVAGTGAGFLYNARLKRTPWSWLPFAVAFPLLPLFGAAVLDAWPRRWWSLFVVGAPAVLAIHLADTIPDLEGDAGAGMAGLAHRLGRQRAGRLCVGALSATCALGAGLGLARRDFHLLTGVALGTALCGLSAGYPATRRAAVPAGAAAVALGWVATLAGMTEGSLR
jgi:4-hydroxybenzoate polyprenyltransferase